MIFAFIDSPVQLLVAGVVLLIMFGPKQLPEIGRELGKALRELKRATSDFSSALHSDDTHDSNRYNSSYEPPKYDSYGNTYDASYHDGTVDSQAAEISGGGSHAALPAGEPAVHGDFAAPALADTTENYATTTPLNAAPMAGPASASAAAPTVRAAADTVARSSGSSAGAD